jgi:hypothetical protein
MRLRGSLTLDEISSNIKYERKWKDPSGRKKGPIKKKSGIEKVLSARKGSIGE